MTPKALLLYSFLGWWPVLLQAQSSAPHYDVIPVHSILYRQTVHLFVYTAKGRQEAPASLPVVYVPGVRRGDHSFYTKINKLVQQGVMPPLLIVGVEPGAGIPDHKADSEEYMDPKHLAAHNPDAESFYYAFIVGEVMPAIEKHYACAPFKTLYADETGSFADFVLKNYAETFTTYLSLSPFVLYDPKSRLRYVKGPPVPTGSGTTIQVEEHTPDEYVLKTGRSGWITDQR